MKYSYIYKATNLVNGKSYIGQSVDPIKRINDHILGRSNLAICFAIKKYGAKNFEWEILYSQVPIASINEIETETILRHNSKYPNGYNLTNGGDGLKGYSPSELTRRNISESLKHRKRGPLSEAHKQKISDANRGRKHSEEHKRRMSDRMIGKSTITPEGRLKLSESSKQRFLGKKLSEKHKLKIGQSGIGRKIPKPTLRKPINKILNEEILETFESAWNASLVTGINSASIIKCANGKRHSAGGFKWKYATVFEND